MPFIDANYTTKCGECGDELEVGDRIFWDPATGDVFCPPCAPERVPTGRPVSLGRTQLCSDCAHTMSAHNAFGCSECSCLRRA
jgi:hypothetical protein